MLRLLAPCAAAMASAVIGCVPGTEEVQIDQVVVSGSNELAVVVRAMELDGFSTPVRSRRALLRLNDAGGSSCENIPSETFDAGPVRFLDGDPPLLVTQEPGTGGATGFGRLGNVTIFERTGDGWQSRSTILHEELLGAWRGSDGELLLLTTLAFRRIADLAHPDAGTPMAPPCVDEIRCSFAPTDDAGGVLAVRSGSGSSLGALRCDAAACVLDAAPIDSDGALHLLANDEPVLTEEKINPDSLVATFADGRRETLADATIATWAATPRAAGGIAVALESFDEGEPLLLFLRGADGAIEQLSLGPADFNVSPGNMAIVATGQGVAEEVHVYRGLERVIEEIVVHPATGEIERRAFEVCRDFG